MQCTLHMELLKVANVFIGMEFTEKSNKNRVCLSTYGENIVCRFTKYM